MSKHRNEVARSGRGARRLAGRGLLLLLCAGAVLPGCNRYVVTDRVPQAYYRTGFPARDVSFDLERAFRSIKRIQVTGEYTTYRFAARDSITAAALRNPATFSRAAERFSFPHTKAGTATVVNTAGREITLVTNAHVIRLPDTLIVYYRGAAGRPQQQPRYVESVSIRTSQFYMVLGLPANRGFRLLAQDSAQDIAAVSVLLNEDPTLPVPVLPVTVGDPSKLNWGSFVYVLGYPAGFRMVTRGIVSDPNRTSDHSFLLDGLFNRGVSGGVILAVRGDTDQLEWVGLATSASATAEYVLAPESRQLEEEGMLLPYEGAFYIERASRIQYGITFSVPLNAVHEFLRGARIPIRLPSYQR